MITDLYFEFDKARIIVWGDMFEVVVPAYNVDEENNPRGKEILYYLRNDGRLEDFPRSTGSFPTKREAQTALLNLVQSWLTTSSKITGRLMQQVSAITRQRDISLEQENSPALTS